MPTSPRRTAPFLPQTKNVRKTCERAFPTTRLLPWASTADGRASAQTGNHGMSLSKVGPFKYGRLSEWSIMPVLKIEEAADVLPIEEKHELVAFLLTFQPQVSQRTSCLAFLFRFFRAEV